MYSQSKHPEETIGTGIKSAKYSLEKITIIKMSAKNKLIWNERDWQKLCEISGDANFEEKSKEELVEILAKGFEHLIIKKNFRKFINRFYPDYRQGKQLPELPKEALCSFFSFYKPKMYVGDYKCENKKNLKGHDFNEYEENQLVYIIDNGKKFCFTVEEIHFLDKNPYTDTPLTNKISLLKGKKKLGYFPSDELKKEYNKNITRSIHRYRNRPDSGS